MVRPEVDLINEAKNDKSFNQCYTVFFTSAMVHALALKVAYIF